MVNWLDKIKGKHILVIGDLIVDKYIIGRVERISPEAPIPIVNQESENFRPGGAANVALNLKQLGVLPSLISVSGTDECSSMISSQLGFLFNANSAIIPISGRITTCKTRVMANLHHIVRIDHEEKTPISDSISDQILLSITALHESKKLEAVIFQDYEKGFFHADNIPKFIQWFRAHQIPILVDPKDQNFWLYKEVDVFKPNKSETEKAIGKPISLSKEKLADVHSTLSQKLMHRLTALTLSDQGIYIHSENTQEWQLPDKREILDVCGAGDAVIAILAALYTVDAPADVMAKMANLVGGIVCEIPGVAPVNPEILNSEYTHHFI